MLRCTRTSNHTRRPFSFTDTLSHTASHTADRAQQAAHSDTVERLARIGYAVKGVLYALVGVLAVQAALGSGGQTTGTRGAIRTIAQAPFGEILLWGIALGLAFYALWRFIEAGLDPDHRGSDAEGVIKRVGLVGSGLIYAGLAYSTFRLVLGTGSSGSSDGAQTWTAKLMAQPFGVWLVGIAGAIAIGIGLYQLYKGWTVEFAKKLKTGEMSSSVEPWAIRLSRFGLAARGVVFVLIGMFAIQAAVTADPQEARGLDGALEALQQQPYGPYLLGLVALGLVAYGVFCLINARYRRFA